MAARWIRNGITAASLSFAACVLAGCFSLDVSHDRNYLIEPPMGSIVALKQDAFVQYWADYAEVRKPDRKSLYGTPLPSIDEFTRPGFVPDPADGRLVLLPRGSRLHLDWVEHEETFESSYMFMWASSADGRFKGEVELNELCEPNELLVPDVFQQPEPYRITLDPDWLEVVKRDNSARGQPKNGARTNNIE